MSLWLLSIFGIVISLSRNYQIRSLRFLYHGYIYKATPNKIMYTWRTFLCIIWKHEDSFSMQSSYKNQVLMEHWFYIFFVISLNCFFFSLISFMFIEPHNQIFYQTVSATFLFLLVQSNYIFTRKLHAKKINKRIYIIIACNRQKYECLRGNLCL